MTNLEDHQAVTPSTSEAHNLDGETVTFDIAPYSWNMLRIEIF